MSEQAMDTVKEKKKTAPLVLRLLRWGLRAAAAVSPTLAGRLAYDHLWFRTTRFPERSRQAKILDRAEQTAFPHDGQPVTVYSWGRGPAVLLVHGWNGRCAQMTPFVDPLVEAGFRVLGVDLPAHGRSPGKRTDIFEIVEALERLAGREGPLQTVIAHSFGTLALLTALQNGTQSERVVCINPAVHLDVLVDQFSSTLHLPAAVARNLHDRVAAFVGEGFYRDLSMPSGTPGLVIHDRDDRDIPWREGKAIAEAWPGAQFMLTEGLGHRGPLRDMAVIERAVGFVRACTNESSASSSQPRETV
jgi:pimeloyl-ACP methyl ester carboxylesterase